MVPFSDVSLHQLLLKRVGHLLQHGATECFVFALLRLSKEQVHIRKDKEHLMAGNPPVPAWARCEMRCDQVTKASAKPLKKPTRDVTLSFSERCAK